MKKFLKILTVTALVMGVVLAIYILTGIDNTLTLTEYTFTTDKISSSVKIAFVSDLHGSEFGENNSELIEMINSSEPDVVLLGGDMFDEESRFEESKTFISQITRSYPVYGVMGNHEYKMTGHSSEEITRLYDELGVTLLNEDCYTLEIRGGRINICGLSVYPENEGFEGRIDTALSNADPDRFTVMVYHRPDKWEDFTDKNIDLMLSGHAHGGQWVLPGVFNGLIAPNQGLFPKYAGGLYEFEDKMSLVVSRGLATDNTIVPRVNNPPELVMITIESDASK